MKDFESLKELILQSVSLGDLMKREGLITGELDEEQFSCKFHGVDRKKSARYYRLTDTSYCWVCKEKLDLISYIKKQEGLSFGGAINHIIKEYRIDTSVLPEATEEHVKALEKRTVPKIDNRKLAVAKIHMAITAVRDEVEQPIYTKFVYAYMMLKYAIPDEKFEEQFANLKAGMLRVFKRLKEKKV